MKTANFTHQIVPAGSPRTGLAILVCMLICVAATAQSGSGGGKGKGGGKLAFKDPVLKSGTAGADGAVYKFEKVDSDIDATVTLVGRSSPLVYLANIDLSSGGFDKAWQPEVGYDKGNAKGPAEWWMEFEVSFFKKGTNTPATVEEFALSAIDIDGNGDKIREYVSFYGPSSYVVESTSLLGINKITGLVNGILNSTGVRFDGPTKNFNNIDTNGTAVMATANFLNSQKFTVRTGAVASAANGAAQRMYSLYFQEFKYNQPAQATLPVNLRSFNATVKNAKVELEWSTADEVNFSHFMLQRSADGRDFSDVAMIMSNSHALDYTYGYSENFGQNAPPIAYYRLKMVDIDGTFKYSGIRIVKLSGSNNVASITTYPNPVTSELRITIPANWQNREVVYDVLNMSGNIVKHKATANASQTETFSVNDIKAGVYVVRLRSGNESATQQIVKK